MAYYQYKGLNPKGRLVSGKTKGSSELEAKERLQGKGIAVKEIRPLEGWLYRDVSIGKSVRTQDLVLFLRQLSTLLNAGVTLVESVSTLADQTGKKKLRAILQDLVSELRAGNAFSSALEKHPNVFSSLFINMVKAGEAGGSLDTILERLATYYEKQYATRRKIISALSYPAVIGAVAIIVVIFLLTFIVPTFADMFASFDSELPAITVFVLEAGELAKVWWWLPIVIAAGGYVGLRWIRQEYHEVRYYTDYLLLQTPVIGKLLQKAAIARMARTLGSLFSNSVPIIQSVSIVEKIVGNEVLARTLRQSRSSLEQGHSITVPMKEDKLVPPMVTQMIEVGEKTGALDTMLNKTADYYEAEVDASADQIRSLIEPLMILFLAVAVGTIVASIAVPMFEVFENVQ
ncbi:type II secretion system F family protein [Alteribacillus iranensis]|uniref:Type IV pilus assembly protein PilC n=1 Tax=Alteribacillus iranensis TaxID=930128 RepID=A0A1I2CQD0_9BACI|nr:type II secretion system F family protein [Alteribacillus iranensis]SFE70511.1 type IV pilus assembly protein PilC [Alteribacillus iranensis]